MASDYFTTSPEMKAPAEVADRRELKIRERREMGEKRYNFGIYYFIMQIQYFNEQNRKIKVWDAEGIVKWYGIMIKWLFGMIKQSRIGIVGC